MLRHPSESFIKYLMTLPRAEAQQDYWVSGSVEQLGFPTPDPTYLKAVRSHLESTRPADFRPNDRFHRDSVRYLRDHRIWALHNPDAAVQQCFQILTNFKARPLIEDLLLGRMEPKEVAKKVNARLGEFFTSETIDAYYRYFWNTAILTVDEWALLLKDLDAKRTNAVAILQVGPAMALHKHGFQQQLDTKTILREMMESVYFDFRDWKAQPRSPQRTKALSTLSRAAVNIDERLAEADSALKESLAAFERFRMKQAEHQVKGMNEIAPHGNYSGSGQKLLDAAEPVPGAKP